MNSTTDKLAEALRDFLEEADQGIVATPFTRESARAALAALDAKPAPADALTQAVDAAMVEMKNIHPPLRRSECQRLIQAALNVAPAAPAHAWQPIDTAPKDGDVLIYVTETDEQFVAYWDDCWRFAPNAKLKTPTHWMPLPPSPEASKKENTK